MKALSEKRLRLLRLLAEHQRDGEYPLVRELAAQLQLAGRTSLTAMLSSLEREGYLHRHGGGAPRHRCIYRLSLQGEAALGQAIVPVSSGRLRLPVLGSIRAGVLAEAVEQCDEWIDPGEALRAQEGDFLLQIAGDSMIGDNILPRDLVQLRPGVEVNNGEIAGVQVERDGVYEATLKHVHFQPGRENVCLRASNPAYDDIFVPAGDLMIVGAYRGLIRRISENA